MAVSFGTYERLSLEDPHGNWELVCGRLRKKPDMTRAHNWVTRTLNGMLVPQLDPRSFAVDAGQARLGISTGSYYLSDLCVIPVNLKPSPEQWRNPDLEVIRTPLPLVVETWSPSTGDYDVNTKLKEYQLRGDQEIWLLHGYERTLTAWRRQPDGSYSETVYRDGTIELAAISELTIDLSALFR
jgi:Uma2 family endonuclease